MALSNTQDIGQNEESSRFPQSAIMYCEIVVSGQLAHEGVVLGVLPCGGGTHSEVALRSRDGFVKRRCMCESERLAGHVLSKSNG
jgi:hypothetical protein